MLGECDLIEMTILIMTLGPLHPQPGWRSSRQMTDAEGI